MWRKKRCPGCSGRDVERWGATAAGTHRWHCRSCGRSFIWSNTANALHRQKIWFHRWLVEGYAVRQLAFQSGHRPWKIQQIIRYWLDRPPAEPTDLTHVCHIIVDGTFIEGRQSGALVVMDAAGREVVFGAYGVREHPLALRHVFTDLRSRGLMPIAATIDGNPALSRVLREIWPALRIQRCLVHVQRQGLMWLRRNPKRTDAKRLRKLFLAIVAVQSFEDRDRFLVAFDRWERRYGARIEEEGERGWIASDLRRARSMLLHARPHLFLFLDDPRVPSCTNALEGYFSRLKEQYRRHRGLSKQRRFAFFRWYFDRCRR